MSSKSSELFSSFSVLQRRVLQEICSPVESLGEHRTLPANTCVEFDPSHVWWIVSGGAFLQYTGRRIVTLHLGDIVGPWTKAPFQLNLATSDDQECTLVGFAQGELLEVISKDVKKLRLWADYQAALCARLFSDFAELKVNSVAPVPQYRHYVSGETIIVEGQGGDDVFVLTEGLAKVSVKGTAVGEIYRDEVFGALGALTESVRTATVTAAEPCDCMIFSKDEFRDLLRAHPDLMSKLFSDFARALHDLNDSVLRASHTKWRNLF